MRVSGRNALVQLTTPDEEATAFDISGVASDGRSRANQFAFEIAAEIAEAVGYGEFSTEPTPAGQSKVSGSITVFYNAAEGEINEYLWAMYQAQHTPGPCADPAGYTLDLFPQGNCVGKEHWQFSQVILENMQVDTLRDAVLIIKLNWRAWQVTCSLVVDALAFPRLGVLDAFRRLDEGPPPSVAWRGPMGSVENGGLAVVDERCVGVNRVQINSAFWATAWEADSEAYLTLTDLPDSPYDYSHLRLWVRMAQQEHPLFPGQILPVGYFLSYTHHYDAVPCALALRRRYFDEAGNYTDAVLWGDHVDPVTVGAGLGVRVTGETLRAFVRLPGGQWTPVGVADDSRFSAGGYGGVQMEIGVWGFTDFGGGTL